MALHGVLVLGMIRMTSCSEHCACCSSTLSLPLHPLATCPPPPALHLRQPCMRWECCARCCVPLSAASEQHAPLHSTPSLSPPQPLEVLNPLLHQPALHLLTSMHLCVPPPPSTLPKPLEVLNPLLQQPGWAGGGRPLWVEVLMKLKPLLMSIYFGADHIVWLQQVCRAACGARAHHGVKC